MEIDSWAVWTFDEDRRITRIETYLDHEEAEARRAFHGEAGGSTGRRR
jgi:hypothetical protein